MQRRAMSRLAALFLGVSLGSGQAWSEPMTSPFASADPPVFFQIIALLFGLVFVIVIIGTKWRELIGLSVFGGLWYLVYGHVNSSFWISLLITWVGVIVPLGIANALLTRRRRHQSMRH